MCVCAYFYLSICIYIDIYMYMNVSGHKGFFFFASVRLLVSVCSLLIGLMDQA